MHSKIAFLFLIFSLPNLCVSIPNPRGAIIVSQCSSGPEANAPIPVNVIVPLCSRPPCILKKGTNNTVEIDFDVPRETENLNVVVKGIINGLELPWSGVGADGCKDIAVGWCPMSAGDYWTYKVTIKVEPFYPSTPLIIKWSMFDDSGNAIWCFHLPAEIVN